MRKHKMPLAFSYLRFSSPEQAKGDSIRRQTEATAAWCQRNGAQLDGSLTLRDQGVSAHKGKHRENPDVHGLARFLDAVKTGRVPAGSYLILENLDRLTREAIVPAVNLFTGLLLAGVKVVQLKPHEQIFTAGADMTAVMLALVELSRGHSESQMKSERVGGAWANKRALAAKGECQRPTARMGAASKVLTRRVPCWIRYDGDRLTPDPTGAAVVRRIFDMARDGAGVHVIAERLNDEKVPVLGRKVIARRGESQKPEAEQEKVVIRWSETVVYHILKSRAVIGEYQPCKGRGSDRKPDGEPIRNYYPAVIDADTYHAVQGILKTRAKVGAGRRGAHVNLFAGLLADARDGGSLTYKHLASRAPALIPVGAKLGRGSVWSSFPAEPFEEAILAKLAEVKVADVEGECVAARKVEALAGRVAELDALVKAWSAKMDDPATVDIVAAKLSELNGKRRKLAEELADAQREAASPLSESWGQFRTLADILQEDNSDELREKVRAALRRSVEKVYCIFTGQGRTRLAGVRVQFRGSDRHRDYVIIYSPGRSNHRVKRRGELLAYAAAWSDSPGDLDLRKRAGAAKAEKALNEIDVDALFEGAGRPKRKDRK
jgi:hypothetical protein